MTNTTYSEFWKQCNTQISPGVVSGAAKVNIYIILEAVDYTQVSPGAVSGAAKVNIYIILEAVHYTQISPGEVT